MMFPVIEVAAGDYPRDLKQMAETANGSLHQLSLVGGEDKIIDGEKGLDVYKRSNKRAKADGSDSDLGSVRCLPKPASAWLQLFHLYNRNIIVLKRDIMHIVLRFVAHLFISIVFGYLYQEVGNNAETLLANFIFVYGSILFLHYTGQMTVLLSFPLEYKILSREHFNRWYSLPSYFVALLLVELPFQAACALLYLIPGYYLTSQPLEWHRFGTYVMFNLAISLTAQATGFLAGALLPITIAVFLAPVFSVFFSVFGFTSRYQDIPSPLRPFYNISYFRSALQGSFLSLYGNGRDELPCFEMYCHYKKPQIFLKDMGFADFQPGPEICYIIFIGLLSYALTILSIWFKLNKR